MKKLFLILAVILGTASAWAQNPEFASTLKKASANLPAQTTEGMTLNSIAESNNNIVYSYVVADDVFANLKTMQDIFRDAMVAELVSSPDAINKEVLSKCKSLNVNIVQNFSNSKGDKITITITPKDMN